MTSKLKVFVLTMVAAFFAVVSMPAAQSAVQKKAHGALATSSPQDFAPAKAVYEQNCARCHGADGRGQTKLGELYNAPDLTNAKRLKRQGNKSLTALITRGRGGMPAFSKKLSRDEINALVGYVRSLKK
ncbi:MAG: c-type cytochrome [Pyrinomonadaceae bacterium]|nr:c-type cytochrome [Pyrinomonadaceae bacterium]MDQ3133607.1 c-type cytochrome [Acidobacteriota bacterium]